MEHERGGERPAGAWTDAPADPPPGRRPRVGPGLLLLLAVLLAAGAVALWVGPDLRATSSNEGEAPMGKTVTFESDGGTYRILSSGSGRPEPARTTCDVIFADGTVGQQVGGGGTLPFPFVPDRLFAFEAPAGPTQVRCNEQGSMDESGGSGVFHVVPGNGPVSWFVVILGVAAGAALVSGVGLLVDRRRKAA